MTRFAVSGQVTRAFPDLLISAVVAGGFDGRSPWPELDQRFAALEASTAAGLPVPGAEDNPHIAAWHAAYRAFGTNPRRQRPSAEALLRRLARAGRLPRINPAVDCYNLVSAVYSVPAGAFDLDQVAGDIEIRPAEGSEAFTPLGEPGTTEHPHPGEVIYTDAAGVLTRHWNHRDAERTKVTEASKRIVFFLETVDAIAFGATLDSATDSLAGLLGGRCGRVVVHQITANEPAVASLQAVVI